MKILVVLALIACACAKDFNLSKNNETCVMLQVEGSVDISVSEGGKFLTNVTLSFDDANVLQSSTCSNIQLDMTKSAQFWFVQEHSGSNFQVVPVSTFNPRALFGPSVNKTKSSPVFTGNSIGDYAANESYTCAAPGPENLPQTSNATVYEFSVNLTYTNFKIQFGGIENDTFSPGPDCSVTTPPTPSTTETPTTSQGPPVTTSSPAPPTLDFNVTSGNITCIKLEGGFKVAVTYLNKEKKNETYTAVVPKGATSDGKCTIVNTNSSMINIHFDAKTSKEPWTLSYTFMKNDAKHYHVSQIDLVYSDLPDAMTPGKQTATYDAKTDYLKAATSGYYTCMANQQVEMQEVTLTSNNFKYKAFNNESDIGFSGDVTECSADDDTNSVVPIAVGAALAGLVVIVLIAYLIGRRRSRKSGYESV